MKMWRRGFESLIESRIRCRSRYFESSELTVRTVSWLEHLTDRSEVSTVSFSQHFSHIDNEFVSWIYGKCYLIKISVSFSRLSSQFNRFPSDFRNTSRSYETKTHTLVHLDKCHPPFHHDSKTLHFILIHHRKKKSGNPTPTPKATVPLASSNTGTRAGIHKISQSVLCDFIYDLPRATSQS